MIDAVEELKPTAASLCGRLLHCPSFLTDSGEWKYDRVPAALMRDLLDYLEDQASKEEEEQ